MTHTCVVNLHAVVAQWITHFRLRHPAAPQEISKAGGTATGDGQPLKHTVSQSAVRGAAS